MVKLQTYRRKRRNPDFRKCAIAAAILSALIMVAVELTGSPVTPANARLSPATAGEAPATAPASAPR